MTPPSRHADEPARLRALAELGLLDTEAEERFDRLTRLAAATLGTPVALITLLDDERQWFKSRVGLDIAETPRRDSFCAHAVAADGDAPFVVEDAWADERFVDNPLVTGRPGIRFYAGQVIRTPAGLPVGTLCVIDDRPRKLDDTGRLALVDLAAVVEAELDRRTAHELLAEVADARRAAELAADRLRLAASASGVGTALVDSAGILLYTNAAFSTILGRVGEDLLDRSLDEFVLAEDGEVAAALVADVVEGRRELATYDAVVVHAATADGNLGLGPLRWARVHRARLETSDGGQAELVQIEDITAARQLEAELRRSELESRAALDALDQGVVLADRSGRIVRFNPAAQRMLGFSAAEATDLWRSGEWEAFDEDGLPMPLEDRPIVHTILTGEAVRGTLVGWRRKDGERLLMRLSCVPIDDVDDTMVIAFSDVTAEHRSRRLLDATLETAPVGLVVVDIDRTIVRCNSMFVEQTGRTVTELEGMDITDLLGDEPDRAEARAVAADVMVTKQVDQPRRPERRVVRPDGDEMWVTSEIALIHDPDQPRAIVATFDVTKERALRLELSRFEYLFRHANDIITVVDAAGDVLYASPSNGRVLGYPEDWSQPGGVLGLVHPDDAARARDEFAALVAGTRGSDPFTLRVRSAAGEWRHLECVGVNLLDEPAVGGIVLTSRDTTDRERLTAQLAHSATHDDLTDLANRNLLESQLTGALARAIRDDRSVGLCFIDLDGFKDVNDSHGHAAGDQLLVEVGQRLRSVIRGGDLAARVGGDEFVVMIDPVEGPSEALAAATRIRDAIVATGQCGASVGVAVSAIDDTSSTLLRRADAALYRAKSQHSSAIELAAPTFH